MSAVTSADGTTIDYSSYGEGPAVILVGGAVQHRAIDEGTTAAARLLAHEGYTAVDYDRRGRGRSGDTAPWSLEREVEDLAALIAVVGGSAVLFTSSSGAAVGLQAAQADVGVTGLITYEPPFFPGAGKADQIDAVRGLVDRGEFDAAMRYNMGTVIGLPAQVVNGIAQSPMWAGMCSVAPTLVYDFSALDAINTDPDWSARWSGVTIPVSVCSGSGTTGGLADAADRVAAALSNSSRRTVPGQDHNPSPEAIAQAALEFFAWRESRTSP